MLNFLKIFFFIYILSKFVFNDFFDINDDFSIHSAFILYFLTVIFFNFRFNDGREDFDYKFDFDILYKFVILFFKTPNFLGNYTLNVIKQIYHFLVYFRFRYLINTIKIIYKRYFSNMFLIWRPLFKKTSYFGYYRSNRSKWIK